MTSDELKDMGRRAVKCGGFRWMFGMLTHPDKLGRTYRHTESRGALHQVTGKRLRQPAAGLDYLTPDFSDAATVGCLLALVRRAWGYPLLSTGPYAVDGAGWSVWSGGAEVCDEAHCAGLMTEAAALVAALESAPC